MIHIKTAHNLLKLFHPEFVEVDSAVFLADELTQGSKPSSSHDKTATESFINHVHILDRFRHAAGLDGDNPEEAFYDSSHPDFKLGCEVAKTLALIWLRKLKAEFPGYRFRVYYTEQDNPVIRFHRVHEGEANWLDESDWREDVAQGKVVVYDTGA
jgi:hypothetical protein